MAEGYALPPKETEDEVLQGKELKDVKKRRHPKVTVFMTAVIMYAYLTDVSIQNTGRSHLQTKHTACFTYL